MIEYAEYEWRQGRKLADKSTEADHTEVANRILMNLPGGKDKIESIPENPPFPDLLDYLWEWWKEFSVGIPENGMSQPTASWDNVQKWSEMMQPDAERWEKKTLVILARRHAEVLSS